MNESIGLATVCAVLQPESVGLGREVQFSFVAQDGSASCKLVILHYIPLPYCIHSFIVMRLGMSSLLVNWTAKCNVMVCYLCGSLHSLPPT